ncbi:hypothetical protein [Hyunsoonleella pacifica]|nr:hypothetical protein [Hyunsoonleella pacifica]GGD28424.1 hypothetical protein GCM10011368_33020 [Hyunsoonleella pacifica]
MKKDKKQNVKNLETFSKFKLNNTNLVYGGVGKDDDIDRKKLKIPGNK